MSEPRRLGDIARIIVARLTPPGGAQPPLSQHQGPIHDHPFVRRVLAAFPGATIISTNERDR